MHLDGAYQNSFATYVQLPERYARLRDIDDLFRRVLKGIENAAPPFPAVFLLRVHSFFLAATQLGMGGCVPETYAVLRGCLENALYGLSFAVNPEKARIWFERHEGDRERQAVRREFTIGRLKALLEGLDPHLHEHVTVLYERTIDMGAHPNVAALLMPTEITKGAKRISVKTAYLSSDPELIQTTTRSTAQVGVTALSILRLVWPDRFKTFGFDQELDVLKTGL